MSRFLCWNADRSLYNWLKASSLAGEVEESLRRPGLDTIDLYQIHWPNRDAEIEEGWEALAKLREQGKIRWIGVPNLSVDQMKRAMKIAPMPNASQLFRRTIGGGTPLSSNRSGEFCAGHSSC